MARKRGKRWQERLREIAWDIGQRFPPSLRSDFVCISLANPHIGHVFWNVSNRSLNNLRRRIGTEADGARPLLRIYDVTEIIFDGSNAHSFFDIEVDSFSGSHYFNNPKPGRDYIAEIGIITASGRFYPIVRSEVFFSPRDSRTNKYSTEGMFTGGYINRRFQVENIFDAPLYEELNRELANLNTDGNLHVAELIVNITDSLPEEDHLFISIKEIIKGLKRFGTRVTLLHPRISGRAEGYSLYKRVIDASKRISDTLLYLHRVKSFDLIHCHEWYSSVPVLEVVESLNIPFVLTLHSIEHERSLGRLESEFSKSVASIERRAIERASVIIVPREDLRQLIMSLFGLKEEKVMVIPYPYLIDQTEESVKDTIDVRRWLSIPPDSPIVLFAGELSHMAGADLLMDAIPTVCRNHGRVYFVFVGEGPLRGELEARAGHEGISARCRFTGHLDSDTFMSVLRQSWCVVIPARTWQDESLARLAISHGIPVLVTHNSGITCVEHGKSGLITYDNPGSIVWGIQELLHNPFRERLIPQTLMNDSRPSADSIAVRHLIHFETAVRRHSKG